MTALQSTLQSQFAEWACKEQSLWSRPVVITIQEQQPLGRDRHGQLIMQSSFTTHVAGAWIERKKMFHGEFFLKLADDDV